MDNSGHQINHGPINDNYTNCLSFNKLHDISEGTKEGSQLALKDFQDTPITQEVMVE